MKKWAIGLSIVAILATSGFVYVSAQEPVKPEKAVVVGMAVAIPHYAMSGEVGEEFAEAHKFQCEEGFPVGILDQETGELYVCVFRDNAPASHLETANEMMAPLMGKKVAASGLVYKAAGVNVLRFGVISEY